jgi:hypothetical protein
MFVCLSVWEPVGSAPGHDRELRPVWPQGESRGKIFLEKWPLAELQKKNLTPLMLSYGKILLHIFAVHFERALRLVIIIFIISFNEPFSQNDFSRRFKLA